MVFTDDLVSNIATQIWNHSLKLKMLNLFKGAYKWAEVAFSFMTLISSSDLRSSYEDVILPEMQELSYCITGLC